MSNNIESLDLSSEISAYQLLSQEHYQNSLNTDIASYALQGITQQLQYYSTLSTTSSQLEEIYDLKESEKLSALLASWANGTLVNQPSISLLDDAFLQGAKGAYAAENNHIYVAKSLTDRDSLTGLTQVLLEEYGHALDVYFNADKDTLGDEGEWFSLIVSRALLTSQDVLRLQSEKDQSTLWMDNHPVTVEQSTTSLDFNSDQSLDILWRDPASGQNVVWFMGGTNNTQPISGASLTTVGGGWSIKGISDFNGDNRPDLLWRDPVSGQNVVWFMGGTNNTQLIGSASLTTVGGGWDIKGISDFNGDNRPDLLWRDAASGQNVVWFMGGTNNTQQIGGASLTTVGGGWDIKGISDFNGDSRPDLLWRDAASGQNVVWFMGGTNNTQLISGASLTTVGGGWDIKGINDFNGDNRPDLLWRDAASGQNVVWFMGGTNNTQQISGANLTTVGGGWTPLLASWMPKTQPDLVVTNQYAPTSANVGDSITISAYTKNQGATASAYNYLRYYLSNDTTLSSDDYSLGNSYVGSLATGSSEYDSLTFNYSSSWGTGTKYILFRADTDNSVAESNESNNLAYTVISVAAPQIRVTSPNGGEYLVPGNRYTLSWADNLSEDVTLSLYNGGALVRTLATTASTGSYAWTVPTDVNSGSNYSLRVQSSINGNLEDWSDAPFTIGTTSLPSQTDIAANTLQVNNGLHTIHQLKPGDKASVGFGVTEVNLSTTKYLVQFYLSSDNVIDQNDVSIGIAYLKPYEYSSYLSSLNLPSATNSIWNAKAVDEAGYALYYIGMKVDAEDQFREFNETNNTLAAGLWVYQPDKIPPLPTITLTATDGSASESANSGKFTFTRTGSTSQAFTVSYLIGGTASNASDYATIGNTVTFQAGQSTADVVINPVDDGAVEGSETVVLTLAPMSGYAIGNSSQATVTIADNDVARPDLTVLNPSVPSTITVGNILNLSATVKNQGTATASSSSLQVYLSSDATYSTNDLLLKTVSVSSLGVGASEVVSISGIDTTLWSSGNQYLLFVADGNNQITESNESNNLVAPAMTVNPKPYIMVTSPNGGNSLTPGGAYTITWNDNISENVKIDLFKGTIYHSTIASSTISNGSYAWVLPSTLTNASDYKIRISSVTNSSTQDTSDNFFTVLPKPSNGFNIEFDYRFDTIGWFTSEKRASLEAAASIWEKVIQDEFTDIAVGTLLSVRNPQTDTTSQFNSDYVIDDLVIFVGARDIPGSAIGIGGSSGIWYSGTELATRYTGADFEPWTGSIAFDSGATWFFDAEPLAADAIPAQHNDFVSVALHEIGHVLGLAYSGDGKRIAYNQHVSGTFFNGPNAVAKNGGNPVPLQPTDSQGMVDLSHIQDGYKFEGQETAMDPTLMVGTRKLPTLLDIALLDDIGYDVTYPVVKTISVTSPNGGNTLVAGNTYTITWTDNISENVKLELYKGTSLVNTLTTSTLSNGSFAWTVPTTLISGSDYQLKITSTTDNTVFDYSNSNFTIENSLQVYWFYYDYNPSDYVNYDSYAGYVIAPKGRYAIGEYDLTNQTNEAGFNGNYNIVGIQDYGGSSSDAGKVFIHTYFEQDGGQEIKYVPQKYSQGKLWAGSNYLGSEDDYIDSYMASTSRFGRELYEADPSSQSHHWKAEYFYNNTLTGDSYIDFLGSNLNFEKIWGTGAPGDLPSPINIPSDNFSARFTTQRTLNAGFYRLTARADDGIRVSVDGVQLIDDWDSVPFAPHSGYFYWAGGTVPISLEYREMTGSAGLQFDLVNFTTPYQDSVGVGQWHTSVFAWDPKQGAQPSTTFWNDSSRKIGVFNFGSTTRSDNGKKGITLNPLDGALLNDGARLPDNFYALRSFTQDYFEAGVTYKAWVRSDDGYQLFAKRANTNEWIYFTPQNTWMFDAYGAHKEISFTVSQTGWYDFHFQHFEGGGDAYFDLSWERAQNPDVAINLAFFGNFTATQISLIEKAAQNWRNIITRDMVPGGQLNIAVSQGTTRSDGTAWNGMWAVTDFPGVYPIGTIATPGIRYDLPTPYDYTQGVNYHTRLHFNSSQLLSLSANLLVRLATHEIGHALYLDDAQYDSLLGMDGVMDLNGLDANITSGIFQRLEYLGYQVDRNAAVAWQ